MVLIWLLLVLNIASMISSYFQYNLLKKMAAGIEVSIETANANDLRERILAVVYGGVFIVSVVTFIRWFRRAYFNMHLRVSDLSYSEEWASGSWFVPIINLYRPLKIMKELYRRTRELLMSNGVDLRTEFSAMTLGWWWTLWIINNGFGQVSYRFARTASTLDDLIIATIAELIGGGIGVFLCLITVKVIKDYAEVEPLLITAVDEIEAIAAAHTSLQPGMHDVVQP